MKHKHLGRIILFGTVVLTCLLVLQVYWFTKAFDVSEKQFDHSVQVALKKVADSVSSDCEIKKLSSNFFFVATESELDEGDLDNLLKKEFLIRSLNVDYELGVYNADDDTLVYGNYVEATKKAVPPLVVGQSATEHEKNFAVYFPGKKSYLAAQMDIWIFSTLILLLMMGFFAYAIYSLLRERKFSALKNDFINNMTHEFKTPVTNVKIAGEILKNKLEGNEGLNVYVDILLKENEKLQRKIDQVLWGSSIEHIRKPALEKIDVHQLISSCADAFQLKVREREGSLAIDLNASNSTILGDRELLGQAINNIIDNAEKYSPNRPRIVVTTRDHEDGIEINVVDEGIGIASNLKGKVFEKFFRVRTGDIHTVKGFGLGLSFVKDVIHRHRGKINLFSEIDRGTEVRIFLPKA
jgi:two-component system, OmpR family, phosphate regulon sensor histidine kinase PhoR